MLLEKRPAYLRFHTFRAFAGNVDKVNVVLFVIWNSNAFFLYTLKPSLPPFVAPSHFIVYILKKKMQTAAKDNYHSVKEKGKLSLSKNSS